MKRKIIRLLTCAFVVATLFALSTVPAMALTWDGTSTGGGINTTPAGPNGYAIRTDGDNVVGYRFSTVDKNGGTKNGAVIDVFRNTGYGNLEYGSAYKFNTKYNKKQLINNQNAGFNTSKNTTNCYKEASMGFASALPVASGMKTWQNDGRNLDPILRKLGIAGIDALKNGDKIIVEPLYDVRLESVYHALTVTEIAIYGKHILGSSSNGGGSSNSGSWGFIAAYTNKFYPNQLFTPDGQGLWTGVSALSKQGTFYTLINSGYGVGIAYTETKPDFTPNLSVKLCEAWPGSVSSRNSNHYGISRGSTFANWEYGHGYSISGSSIWYAVNFPAEAENCYVRQSVWVVGGGSISRNVWSNSNTWYDVSLSPTTVSSSASYYTIKARVDWLDGNSNVQKWGVEKTFYIPIRPKINRYQVTMYSVTGATAAYSGDGGSSGVVYVGQRVRAKYTYTSDNSWTSYNYLRGRMYKWSSGAWNPVKAWNAGTGDADLYVDNAGLNSGSAYNRYSDIGLYTVPDNSANTTGSNRIPFYLWTHWASDIEHTTETKWIDIPIVKADAEITNIRLIDNNGYYLDPTDLEAGQQVTVQYTYKNNTSCTIYVNGYNNDRSQISGIYAIEPGKTVNVNGYSFEVPNQRKFNIWGGVYLDGAGIYNTSYETNRNNNTMTLECEVNHPLRIYPIAPNASYREGTEVVSSFWVKNGYRDNYIPANQVTAHFKVTKTDGSIITVYTVPNVAVPGNDKNLVYFKWRVPTGLNYSDIRITASIIDDSEFYNAYSRSYSTIPYTYSVTPDTQFEESKPSGFTFPASPTASAGNATWWQYKYENGAFVKHTYGIGIYNAYDKEITPATGSTAYKNGSDWIMKSGYGFSIKIYRCATMLSGYEYAPYSAYTGIQYAYATFPEYGYSSATGKCRTLEIGGNGTYWEFRQNGSYEKVHFTPLWYPDGNYTVKSTKRDMWTPSGMLSASVVTNAIKISGSAYDDWFVGQK